MIFKNDFQIFRENNKAGFYLLLQPLSPRAAGRGMETSGALTPEAQGVAPIVKFKFSCGFISSPRKLTWTSCSGSQLGSPSTSVSPTIQTLKSKQLSKVLLNTACIVSVQIMKVIIHAYWG